MQTRRKFISVAGLIAAAFDAVGGPPQPDEPAKVITETRLWSPDGIVLEGSKPIRNEHHTFAIIALTIRRVKTYACSDSECCDEPHMHERIEWARATIGPIVLDRWIENKTGDRVQQVIDKLVEEVVAKNLFRRNYECPHELGTISIG